MKPFLPLLRERPSKGKDPHRPTVLMAPCYSPFGQGLLWSAVQIQLTHLSLHPVLVFPFTHTPKAGCGAHTCDPSIGRLREEGHVFKVSFNFKARPFLNDNKYF